MGLTITLPTEANVAAASAEAFGYDALFEYGTADAESLYLRLAVGPGRQQDFEILEPEDGPDVSANPEDMRSETGRPFSRSNFTGGEGLDRAHRRDGTERDYTRFWDSRNIDITPARGGAAEEVKLLHSASSLRSADASNSRMPLVRIEISGTDYLFGVIDDDAQVDRTSDPTASSPSWAQESPGGTGDVMDLAGLGDELYAARSSLRVRDSGGSWTEFTNLAATRLWAAKGRIIAAVGTSLYEAVSGTDNSVLLHTLPSGKVWNDVVDAGAAILAAASDGTIYAFADEDGTLALRRQTEFEGEIPTALGFAQGLVFIGTSETTTGGGKIGRLYSAELVGLRIVGAQTLREWGTGSTTVDRSPHRIAATREAVWTGVIEDGSETHLWRYHLETGGVVRDLILGASGQVHGIASFDDRIFATVFGDALYREDTTYASEGWLIGPLADFYDASRKAWVGARMTPGALPTGTDAVLAYTTDPAAIEDDGDSSWTDIVSMDETTLATAYSAETAITAVEARYLAGKLTLTPNGASTATPTVLAFAFRAVSLPTEAEFRLPINVSDRYERPGQKPVTINGLGQAVWNQLAALKGKAGTITLLRSGQVIKGQLRHLTSPVQEMPRWGSETVFALLTVRGQLQ